jgi:hypothetical protein
MPEEPGDLQHLLWTRLYHHAKSILLFGVWLGWAWAAWHVNAFTRVGLVVGAARVRNESKLDRNRTVFSVYVFLFIYFQSIIKPPRNPTINSPSRAVLGGFGPRRSPRYRRRDLWVSALSLLPACLVCCSDVDFWSRLYASCSFACSLGRFAGLSPAAAAHARVCARRHVLTGGRVRSQVQRHTLDRVRVTV